MTESVGAAARSTADRCGPIVAAAPPGPGGAEVDEYDRAPVDSPRRPFGGHPAACGDGRTIGVVVEPAVPMPTRRDPWVTALHNLYLVALVVAVAMTLASVVVPAPLTVPVLWLVTGLTPALLCVADMLARRWQAAASGSGVMTGYFLLVSVVLGALAALFPTFTVVAFGLLPLAFVRLRRAPAVVVGVLMTGLPYLVQSSGIRWLFGDDAPPGTLIRYGPGYLAAVGVALPVLTGLFTASAIQAVQRQSRAYRAVVEQLSATRAELASASRLAGQAEERQRLAHELHDTLAQGLSGVVLQLEAAEQQLDLDHDTAGQSTRLVALARLLAVARATARGCLADTRRTVEALRPEPLDGANLSAALTHVCQRWTETTGVPARVTVRGEHRPWPPQLEVVGLRVVQEALANTAKHASANEVSVTAGYARDTLSLVVHDNGRGFDPAHAPTPDGYTSGGLGLSTMRERVAAVGGTVVVASAPGAGTTITAILPGTPAPASATTGR